MTARYSSGRTSNSATRRSPPEATPRRTPKTTKPVNTSSGVRTAGRGGTATSGRPAAAATTTTVVTPSRISSGLMDELSRVTKRIDSRLDRFLVNGHHGDRRGVADQREEHDQVDPDGRAQEAATLRQDEHDEGDGERLGAR